MPVIDVSREQVDFLHVLAEAEHGEEFVIACDGKPVAKLIGLKPRGQRSFGALQGRVSVDDRFFEPLPPDELAAWEDGAGSDPKRPPDSGTRPQTRG